jgi:hypothetical protein
MSLDPAALPRDPDRLIEMIVALQDENSRLHAMLEAIRRTLYGARSERFETDTAQLALDLQDTATAPIEPPPAKPVRLQNRSRTITRSARSQRVTSGACPSTCRARTWSSSPASTAVLAAMASCIASARTSAKCSMWCRQ